jgi:large subunit ribosomal protein L25
MGEAAGVKNDGGILEVQTHSIEVRCLPRDLLSVIEIDVTPLGIGDKFKVGDLKLDGKVEILDDPETVIASVVAPRLEEPAPEVAPEATAEPEVIKKGKAEETE